jgi:formylglycine-generating enzyme required for sulfatase activity
MGFISGGLLAVCLLIAPPLVSLVGFVVILGLATLLAYSGEPVAVAKVLQADDEWVDIPPGRFRMGSPEDELDRRDDENPVHWVEISGFQCRRTPVTRRLYKQVMGHDPGWPKKAGDSLPVNNVSWGDAVRFCNSWSEQQGLMPCYQIEEDRVSWDVTKDGYRLLTEAEWEYACRAGTEGRWYFGDEEAELGAYAWYDKNSKNTTHPVGTKKPNAWGLYDMHGNVWEWCWDWYGAYSSEHQYNPAGPPNGEFRVLRGGAFNFPSRNLRSAGRNWIEPEYRIINYGFRCARGPRRQD